VWCGAGEGGCSSSGKGTMEKKEEGGERKVKKLTRLFFFLSRSRLSSEAQNFLSSSPFISLPSPRFHAPEPECFPTPSDNPQLCILPSLAPRPRPPRWPAPPPELPSSPPPLARRFPLPLAAAVSRPAPSRRSSCRRSRPR